MTNQNLKSVLTKRALQRQLQDRGLTRSQALRVMSGMQQEVRWARLPLTKRLQIMLKVATSTGTEQ